MLEKYSEPDAVGVEPALSVAAVRELLGRLLPRADGALLLEALMAEDRGASIDLPAQLDEDALPSARELTRVRRVYLAGERAQSVHLAMSNTLTALQTQPHLRALG